MSSFSPEIDFVKKIAIPYVTKFWSNALRVFPVVGGIRVQEGFCPVTSESYSTEGVPDSDLVIVLAANMESVCQSGAMAAARSCQADQWDRPTVGTAVLCLDKLDVNDEDSRIMFIRVILHEFAHVLGMRSIDFPYFYEPETGLPRTARPFKKERVQCVDDYYSEVTVPSKNTLTSGLTKRGLRYYQVVTPRVKQVVRNQFDCQTMEGARLENQPTNDGNCFGTHWEARLYASEFMSAITKPTKQVVSPVTLALFEDSGWYKADYSVTQLSTLGRGSGCDFVYEDCIKNGKVPDWG